MSSVTSEQDAIIDRDQPNIQNRVNRSWRIFWSERVNPLKIFTKPISIPP